MWGKSIALAAAGLGLAMSAGLADTSDSTRQSAPSSGHWLFDKQSNCAVFDTKPHDADAMTWSGDCANGLADGQGTVTYYNDGKFVGALTGKFDKGALRDGPAAERWADGSYFQGNEASGRIHGAGVLTTAQGDRFDGQWTDDRLNGHGVVTWANGDRYEGDMRDSKADGHGVQLWADGRTYEGDWQNDQPNGHGVLTLKDGARREGEFADGKLQEPPTAVASSQANATAATSPAAAASAGPVATAPPPSRPATQASAKPKDRSAADPMRGNPPWLDALAGQKLVAVDGSAVTLSTSEDGFARELVAPDGGSQKSAFTFLNDKQGTVANANDVVVGFFRATDTGFDAQYADGHSETLVASAAAGLSVLSRAASGDSSCTAWYPPGHEFSAKDRQAALAAYANRLGLSQGGKKQPVSTSCAPSSDQRTAADSRGKTDASNAPAAASSRGSRSQRGHRSRLAKTADLEQRNRAGFLQPILVRASVVHTIDADTADTRASLPAPQRSALIAPISPTTADVPGGQGASSCLSIDNNGEGWGFRNRCDYSIQFAYCLANGEDAATSCAGGFAAGSVAAHGFDALLADRSIVNSEHDFRWIGCSGSSGEVSPRLIRGDPPVGRCDRARAS